MGKTLSLNLLYNFLSDASSSSGGSYYRVLYFFSSAGPITYWNLEKIYSQYNQVGPKDWICFEDMETLGDFALKVCSEVSASEVYLLSAQDYNLGLESCNDRGSYRDLFHKYGTCLEFVDNVKGRKSLLKKIFS